MSDAVLELAVSAADFRLVLARHGETPSNIRRALDTVLPGPGLTNQGQQQARQLADRLATEKVLAVHASQARRAQETARPVAARHELDVTIAEGIHEIDVGSLEGNNDKNSLRVFEETYARWLAGDLDEPMPDGETGRQALSRFLTATQRMVEDVSAGSVVVVSHGAMLRLACTHLSSNLQDSRAALRHLPNTGVIVLEPAPRTSTGWHCAHWDGLDLD